MNATQAVHALGQSIWLDNLTRDLLGSGTLQRYIDSYAVTGLTSNPTIFDKAFEAGQAYDAGINAALAAGKSGEDLFFEVALDDIRRAADLFRAIFDRTDGVDGWVSLEVSPKLAHDTQATLASAKMLHQLAGRPNVFIKIPGTPEGLPAIEECIFAGIPINVTLLFSREQYLAAAEAYARGVERRVQAGLPPRVASVASLFISRWDTAVAQTAPPELRNRLGVAIGKRCYQAYREFLDSARMQRLYNEGGRPQRLLWASTGTKDPAAPDTLYVTSLLAPFTINTMPDKTLEAVFDHGQTGPLLDADGGDAQTTLQAFAKAGVDIDALAARLQDEGAKAFVKSWTSLLDSLASKSAQLETVR